MGIAMIDLTSMLLAAAITAGAGPDPKALLARSDAARNPWPSFVVRTRIRTYEHAEKDEEHLYEVYQKGSEKTFVEFLSPRDKGRHLLMLGDDMWVYLPDTSRPVRITPLERLTGQASNGDVARTNYSVDYAPTYRRRERVGTVDCDLIELVAARRGTTYRRILYWLAAETALPVKAEYFVASGKHIKTATFDEYQQVRGRTLLRQMTIRDEVRKGARSVLVYESIEPRDLPDRMFHQDRTGREP